VVERMMYREELTLLVGSNHVACKKDRWMVDRGKRSGEGVTASLHLGEGASAGLPPD
jgi:hypothetical protein